MIHNILSVFVLCLVIGSTVAFVEDIYLPITEPPLPTTTTPRPTQPPPPRPAPADECSLYCKEITSCKQILTSYLKYSDTCDKFNWDCFSNRYRHCSASINCPPDHIRSGFGRTFPQHNRCMPLYMCKYFAKIYTHVNELHDDITWS